MTRFPLHYIFPTACSLAILYLCWIFWDVNLEIPTWVLWWWWSLGSLSNNLSSIVSGDQSEIEIVQLREFNKELVMKVLDGPESLTGERGEAQWEAIAESLYPPPLGFGKTNRGTELTDPWSHLPQMVLERESQRRAVTVGEASWFRERGKYLGFSSSACVPILSFYLSLP